MRAAWARDGCTDTISHPRRRRIVGRNYSLQVFCVFGLPEVLKVAEVGHELRLVEHFLHGEVIEIDGIGKTLHELGGVSTGTAQAQHMGKVGERTSSSSSKREKPP